MKKDLVLLLTAILILTSLVFVAGCKKEEKKLSYEEVAAEYIEAAFEYDYEKMAKLTPFDTDKFAKDVVEEVGDQEDMSKKEVLEEISDELDVKVKKPEGILSAYSKYSKKEQKEYMKDNDITDYKMEKLKIMDATELDDDELDDVIGDVKEWFKDRGFKPGDYINTDKIKKGYEVEYRYEIHWKENGDKEDDEVEGTLYVVKYGGEWLVLNESVLYAIINTGYMVY